MKKSILATSLCGILVTTNVITGWQFKKELDEQKYEYDQVINNLHSLTEQYDDKIKKQQDNINELNTQIDNKDKKLVELSQQLEELKSNKKQERSP
ncbi:hypothetical protein [Cytobacillus praedii]|uniref:Uncharacterized protein n=1 Tax=Cytobacillus praedii TaxID=1742358 RepID=A0A4R1ASH7_9BACI|nr:hypothetical protein [Cytobacillus praedii]TCJ00471.1 hypothetical protein E0Y62_26730 [Cytobacillus praedii]